jgi:biopolymer transport protein ExbB/TolQ
MVYTWRIFASGGLKMGAPVMIGLMGLATGAQVFGTQQAAEMRNKQLEMQQANQKLQTAQKQRAESEQLNKVIDNNTVAQVARGFTTNSGSFQAIQRSAFDKYEEDKNANALNLTFRDNYLKSQMDINTEAADINSVGAVANFGFNAFNLMKTRESNQGNNR